MVCVWLWCVYSIQGGGGRETEGRRESDGWGGMDGDCWDAGTPLNPPCQEVGFICPFVVIDPTDLGATTAIARNLLQDKCLTISYLSPTQNPCLFTLWY